MSSYSAILHKGSETIRLFSNILLSELKDLFEDNNITDNPEKLDPGTYVYTYKTPGVSLCWDDVLIVWIYH